MRMTLRRCLIILLTIRFTAAFISCFLPLNFPHLWRQTDTMGVALRYWLRWTVEKSVQSPLYPAVLNSGDHYGITPMEFPFLNIISAPFFYFGPYWGRVTSHLFLCFILLFLIIANIKIWKNSLIQNIPVFEMLLLLSFFSYANPIAWHFMPDFLSLLLCLTSIGLIWKHNRYTLPFLFATLGLLIKPTTVIVFLLFLTHENITKKVKHLFWFIPSVLVTLFYYTIAIKYIEKKQDIGTLFAINPRPILSSLKDFFSDFSSLADNLNYHAFVPYIFCTFLILSLYIYWKEKTFPFLKLWIIAALQIFIIAALDGKHSYIHYYYFIGVAPTFTLIALGLWHKTGKLPLSIGWILKLIFIALFLGRLFDIIHFDLRGFKETPDGGSPFFQCQELMKAHPEFPWHQGFVFRSPAENFPALGLCFGEREGSQKSDFGFIYTNNNIPKNCQIQDKRSSVALIKCS